MTRKPQAFVLDGDKEEPRLKAARAHIAFDPEPENQDLVVVPQASLDAPPRRMRWGRLLLGSLVSLLALWADDGRVVMGRQSFSTGRPPCE